MSSPEGVFLQFEPQPLALETCWYTVGLAAHGHPELIVFGLPPDISRPVLNDLVADLIAGRRSLAAGQSADDIVEGHRFLLVPVSEPDRHLPVAAQLHPDDLRALQLVWPDRHQRWPWQPGTQLADMPVLGEHP